MDVITELQLPAIEVDQNKIMELESSAVSVLVKAREVADSIVDDATLVAAQRWCGAHATHARELRKNSWLADIAKTWHKQHKNVVAIIERYASPHEMGVKDIVDPKINAYLDAKEAQRRADEKRLRDEAEKRDEEQRLAKAIELEKQGRTAHAEAVLNKPAQFVAPKIEPTKVEGLSRRKSFKVRPIDPSDTDTLIKIIKAVADGVIPLKVLSINEGALNRYVDDNNGATKVEELNRYVYEYTSNTHRNVA